MTTPVLSYLEHAPIDAVPVSLDKLMVGGLLLQAGSGGGKSTAIRQALEETHGRVQHLVLDPEGEFGSLCEKFDYVYAAPHGGQAVANPKSARLLCRRLVEVGVSAVLDIYDLKVPEKREFVRLFLEELMVLPRTMWKPILVVVDEADLFAPQNGEASSTEAIIDVNGRGRKRGYRLILTTRRISKLHKDAADLQNRMIGRTGLDLDVKRAGDELGMDKETRQSLPRLEPGTFYVYGPAISARPILAQTGRIQTTHPTAGRIGSIVPPARAKISALISQFADLPKEAEEEARTMEDLRRSNREKDAEIAKLRRGGAVTTVEKPVVDQRAIDRAVAVAVKPYQQAKERARRDVEKSVGILRSVITIMEPIAVSLGEDAVAAVLNGTADIRDVLRTKAVSVPAPTRPAATPRPSSNGAGSALGKGARATLAAIAQHEHGVTREQLTILTGYKRSSRNTYLQRLQAAGCIRVTGDNISATTEGIGALGDDFEPLPVGDKLRAYWLDRLSGGEQKILALLADKYPGAMTRDAIGEATGYERSSRNTYIQRLGARKLVGTEGGWVRAEPMLFGGGR